MGFEALNESVIKGAMDEAEKETQKLVLKVIKGGKMPKAHSNFRDTKEGKKLIHWLEKISTE